MLMWTIGCWYEGLDLDGGLKSQFLHFKAILLLCRPLKENLKQQECQLLKYQKIHETAGKLFNLEIPLWYDSCYEDIHKEIAYHYLVVEIMLESADWGWVINNLQGLHFLIEVVINNIGFRE